MHHQCIPIYVQLDVHFELVSVIEFLMVTWWQTFLNPKHIFCLDEIMRSTILLVDGCWVGKVVLEIIWSIMYGCNKTMQMQYI